MLLYIFVLPRVELLNVEDSSKGGHQRAPREGRRTSRRTREDRHKEPLPQRASFGPWPSYVPLTVRASRSLVEDTLSRPYGALRGSHT